MRRLLIAAIGMALLLSTNASAQLRRDDTGTKNTKFKSIDISKEYSDRIVLAIWAAKNNKFDRLKGEIECALDRVDAAGNFEQPFYFLDKESPKYYQCEIANIAILAFDNGTIENALGVLSMDIRNGKSGNAKLCRNTAIARLDEDKKFAETMRTFLKTFLDSDESDHCSFYPENEAAHKNKVIADVIGDIIDEIDSTVVLLDSLYPNANALAIDPALRQWRGMGVK